MKFLLVNPYYPIDETPSPPLGLAFIAAALEQAGIEVKLLDFVVYPYDIPILESAINDFSPDFVGATSVTMSFDSAIAVIKDVKSINPNIMTVMGGPHVSFHAEETLNTFPELDFIIRGEGEKTIVELTDAVQNRKNPETVNGISFLKNGRLFQTPDRDLSDVNSLPLPARHHIPLGRYKALGMPISMTSSRGCPFKCIFCVGRKMVGAKVRYRNPKSVVDEMVSLQRLGFHQINLADDLFTANKQHCHAVCDEILNRSLNLSWTSFARVDTVSEDVLVKMKAAGCHTVSFGVETGNAEMLKRIKKGITLNQVIAAVEMCNTAGVVPHVSFILGLPGETPETLKETVAFGEKLKNMGVQHGFHVLAPFPGTEVRDEIEKYDLKILTHDWSQYHANRAIVETSTVDKKMLDDVVLEWEEKYKQHLVHLGKLREEGKGNTEELWPLIRLEHTVLIYDLFMEKILETACCFENGENSLTQAQLLEKIVENIKQKTDTKYPSEELMRTLTFAIEQGYATWSPSNGTVQINWVNYL